MPSNLTTEGMWKALAITGIGFTATVASHIGLLFIGSLGDHEALPAHPQAQTTLADVEKDQADLRSDLKTLISTVASMDKAIGKIEERVTSIDEKLGNGPSGG